ncbi:MAG TPA: hypothetical protein VK581_11675 [Chthoniobacterales bacterium]|nr:hypothetical protein [Chthoniobacterales bacterium]
MANHCAHESPDIAQKGGTSLGHLATLPKRNFGWQRSFPGARSRLAWFDHVHAFVDTLADGRQFRIDYPLEGTPLGGFVASADKNPVTARLKNAVDWLAKCRFVANHYGVDAILPNFGEITYAQQRDVEVLHALGTGNFVADSIAGLPFGFSGSVQMPLPENWKSSTEPITGTLKLIGPGQINFFGQIIEIPEVEQFFTDMELVEIKVGESSKHFCSKAGGTPFEGGKKRSSGLPVRNSDSTPATVGNMDSRLVVERSDRAGRRRNASGGWNLRRTIARVYLKRFVTRLVEFGSE